MDCGGEEQINLNFEIELNKDLKFQPIHLAAVKGSKDIMKAILKNTTVDIEVLDKKTGVNSFWLAAYYGHGEIMNLLAEKGIDIMNTHFTTLNNALHIATDRKLPHIVQ